jgi:hypothetical protein
MFNVINNVEVIKAYFFRFLFSLNNSSKLLIETIIPPYSIIKYRILTGEGM